jgi:hypothetical protein
MLVGEFPRVVLGDSFVGTAGIVVHVREREMRKKSARYLMTLTKSPQEGTVKAKGRS